MLVVCLLINLSAANVANLTNIRAIANNRIELQGNFGKDCKRCEIIVNYGKGLKYAYRPQRWLSDKLVFTVKDLGRSVKVKVAVSTRAGKTKPLPYQLKIKLSPATISRKVVTASKVNKKTIYAAQHEHGFGGKGVDEFNISHVQSGCNQRTPLFHKASIVIVTKRFGDVRIEKQPLSGCKKCSPIKVRWYHEPTGSIHYQLHIQYRMIEGECQQQIR